MTVLSYTYCYSPNKTLRNKDSEHEGRCNFELFFFSIVNFHFLTHSQHWNLVTCMFLQYFVLFYFYTYFIYVLIRKSVVSMSVLLFVCLNSFLISLWNFWSLSVVSQILFFLVVSQEPVLLYQTQLAERLWIYIEIILVSKINHIHILKGNKIAIACLRYHNF